MRGRQARARSASLVALALTLASFLACGDDDVAPVDADAGVEAGVDAPFDVPVNDVIRPDADPGATEPAAIMVSPGKDEDPSIIRANDGTYHLAFYSNRDGADRVWMATSPDGLVWSAPHAVTDSAEHAFYPCLLQAKDGRFHLTWFAGAIGDGGKLVGAIRYASSNDTQTWSTAVSLTDFSGLAWGATIAEPTPGKIFAVWSSDAAGDKDLYTASSANGGGTWSAPTRRIDPAFNDDLPFVVAKPDGSLLMAWQRFDAAAKNDADYATHPTNELVYATSTDGTTWSSPVALTADAPGSLVPDVIPALFANDDASSFFVTWSSIRLGATKGNVYAMDLSKAPASATNVVQLTPDGDYGGRLVTAGAPGRFILVWVKGLDIWARRL